MNCFVFWFLLLSSILESLDQLLAVLQKPSYRMESVCSSGRTKSIKELQDSLEKSSTAFKRSDTVENAHSLLHFIFESVVHQNEEVRKLGFSMLKNFIESFEMFQKELCVHLATIVKGSSFTKSSRHLFKEEPSHVLKVISIVIKLLGKELHKNDVLRQMSPLLMEGFKSAPDVVSETFLVWDNFIQNFSLDTDFMCQTANISFILLPLNINVGHQKVYEIMQRTFWAYLLHFKDKLSFHFNEVAIPILEKFVLTPLEENTTRKYPTCDELSYSTGLKCATEILIRLLEQDNSSPESTVQISLDKLNVPVNNLVLFNNFDKIVRAAKIIFFFFGKQESYCKILCQLFSSMLHLILNERRRSARKSVQDAVSEALSSMVEFLYLAICNEYWSSKLCSVCLVKLVDLPSLLLKQPYQPKNSMNTMESVGETLVSIMLQPYVLRTIKTFQNYLKEIISISMQYSFFPLRVVQLVIDGLEKDNFQMLSLDDLLTIWLSLATLLLEPLAGKEVKVYEGKDSACDFSCFINMLTFAVSHFVPPPIAPKNFQQVEKLWASLAEKLILSSAVIHYVQEDAIINMLSVKLLGIIRNGKLKNGQYFQSICSLMQVLVDHVYAGSGAQKSSGGEYNFQFFKFSRTLGNLTPIIDLLIFLVRTCETLFTSDVNGINVSSQLTKPKIEKFLSILDLILSLMHRIKTSSLFMLVMDRLAQPLSLLFDIQAVFDKNTTSFMFAMLEEFWTNVTTLIRRSFKGPYDQAVIRILSPLLVATLNHPRRSICEKSKSFWLATFSPVQYSLEYPDRLRDALIRAKVPGHLQTEKDITLVIDEMAAISSLSQPSLDTTPIISPLPKLQAAKQLPVLTVKFPQTRSAKKKSPPKPSIYDIPEEEFVIISPAVATIPVTLKHHKVKHSFVPAMYNDLSNACSQSRCDSMSESSMSTQGTAVDTNLAEVSVEGFFVVQKPAPKKESVPEKPSASRPARPAIVALGASHFAQKFANAESEVMKQMENDDPDDPSVAKLQSTDISSNKDSLNQNLISMNGSNFLMLPEQTLENHAIKQPESGSAEIATNSGDSTQKLPDKNIVYLLQTQLSNKNNVLTLLPLESRSAEIILNSHQLRQTGITVNTLPDGNKLVTAEPICKGRKRRQKCLMSPNYHSQCQPVEIVEVSPPEKKPAILRRRKITDRPSVKPLAAQPSLMSPNTVSEHKNLLISRTYLTRQKQALKVDISSQISEHPNNSNTRSQTSDALRNSDGLTKEELLAVLHLRPVSESEKKARLFQYTSFEEKYQDYMSHNKEGFLPLKRQTEPDDEIQPIESKHKFNNLDEIEEDSDEVDRYLYGEDFEIPMLANTATSKKGAFMAADTSSELDFRVVSNKTICDKDMSHNAGDLPMPFLRREEFEAPPELDTEFEASPEVDTEFEAPLVIDIEFETPLEVDTNNEAEPLDVQIIIDDDDSVLPSEVRQEWAPLDADAKETLKALELWDNDIEEIPQVMAIPDEASLDTDSKEALKAFESWENNSEAIPQLTGIPDKTPLDVIWKEALEALESQENQIEATFEVSETPDEAPLDADSKKAVETVESWENNSEAIPQLTGIPDKTPLDVIWKEALEALESQENQIEATSEVSETPDEAPLDADSKKAVETVESWENNIKAIPEVTGIPHEAPLDAIWEKALNALELQENKIKAVLDVAKIPNEISVDIKVDVSSIEPVSSTVDSIDVSNVKKDAEDSDNSASVAIASETFEAQKASISGAKKRKSAVPVKSNLTEVLAERRRLTTRSASKKSKRERLHTMKCICIECKHSKSTKKDASRKERIQRNSANSRKLPVIQSPKPMTPRKRNIVLSDRKIVKSTTLDNKCQSTSIEKRILNTKRLEDKCSSSEKKKTLNTEKLEDKLSNVSPKKILGAEKLEDKCLGLSSEKRKPLNAEKVGDQCSNVSPKKASNTEKLEDKHLNVSPGKKKTLNPEKLEDKHPNVSPEKKKALNPEKVGDKCRNANPEKKMLNTERLEDKSQRVNLEKKKSLCAKRAEGKCSDVDLEQLMTLNTESLGDKCQNASYDEKKKTTSTIEKSESRHQIVSTRKKEKTLNAEQTDDEQQALNFGEKNLSETELEDKSKEKIVCAKEVRKSDLFNKSPDTVKRGKQILKRVPPNTRYRKLTYEEIPKEESTNKKSEKGAVDETVESENSCDKINMEKTTIKRTLLEDHSISMNKKIRIGTLIERAESKSLCNEKIQQEEFTLEDGCKNMDKKKKTSKGTPVKDKSKAIDNEDVVKGEFLNTRSMKKRPAGNEVLPNDERNQRLFTKESMKTTSSKSGSQESVSAAAADSNNSELETCKYSLVQKLFSDVQALSVEVKDAEGMNCESLKLASYYIECAKLCMKNMSVKDSEAKSFINSSKLPTSSDQSQAKHSLVSRIEFDSRGNRLKSARVLLNREDCFKHNFYKN